LAGLSVGKTLIGGTASGVDLTLQSTSNATRGNIFFGTLSTYDEVNGRLGVGTVSPITSLHLAEANSTTPRNLTIDNYANITGGAQVFLRKTRGATVGAFSQVLSGDVIGSIASASSDGSAFLVGASFIRTLATENQTTTNQGNKVQLICIPAGSASATVRWEVTGNGELVGATATSFIDLTAVTTKVLKVPTDNTDPTGGGGAAVGQIPIHDAAGNLRHIAYY